MAKMLKNSVYICSFGFVVTTLIYLFTRALWRLDAVNTKPRETDY